MLSLNIQNNYTTVKGDCNSSVFNILRDVCSYKTQNYEWTSKYQSGQWDGTISLFNKRTMQFPTGLYPIVSEAFKEANVTHKIIDERVQPTKHPRMQLNPQVIFRDYQKNAIESIRKDTRGILAMCTGSGKALDILTPIPTPFGWKTMEEIQDGDKIYDEQGEICSVVKAHDILYDRQCYEIVFSNGESLVACDEHLWRVRITPRFNRHMPVHILTSQEIFNLYRDSFLESTNYRQRVFKNLDDRPFLFIDKAKPLSGIEQPLLIDPYLLGIWLGDGASASAYIYSDDEEIIKIINERGDEVVKKPYPFMYLVKNLHVKLRTLNLLNNKHIPKEYLLGSYEQRLELLQGLMDSDGTKGTNFEFCSSKKILAENTLELIRSLGFSANLSVNKAKLYDKDCGLRYRIAFTSSNKDIFKLTRKKNKVNEKRGRNTKDRIYIKSIKPIQSRPVKCLTVDSPSSLYLAGKTLIPTHNTKTSCGIIEDLSVYPVIFVVPSIALLLQTVEEFKDSLIPQEDNMEIGIIGGGKCIINPRGVNVATYHTLLNAYDKKYSDTKYTMLDIKDKTNVVALKKQLKNLETDLIHSASKKKVENQIKKVKAQLASISQAAEKKENLRNLVQNCQLLFIDETHIAAEIIEFISLKCVSAYYKCGLTGTPQRMDNQDIRMFGATGPVIMRVTSSDLIKRGFLVRPYVYCIDLTFLPKTPDGHWTNVYKAAIVNNQPRNELIRDLAVEMHMSGRPTLIMVEHLNHGEQLQEMIENSVFVPGGDGSDNKDIPKEELDYRRYQLNRLERNEIVMIATSWSFTGVDAPKISCIILACSIGSLNTVTQQVGRGLRIAPDKSDCIIFDFKMPEKSLRQQFNSRVRFYKSEPEFVVKNFKYISGKGFICSTQ